MQNVTYSRNTVETNNLKGVVKPANVTVSVKHTSKSKITCAAVAHAHVSTLGSSGSVAVFKIKVGVVETSALERLH